MRAWHALAIHILPVILRQLVSHAGEYMALPASQYSVLDGNQVERLSDDTFRVFVEGFRFFSFTVQPVLTLQVQATDRGCVISMLACKLKGSKIVEAQNSQFRAQMSNRGVA